MKKVKGFDTILDKVQSRKLTVVESFLASIGIALEPLSMKFALDRIAATSNIGTVFFVAPAKPANKKIHSLLRTRIGALLLH